MAELRDQLQATLGDSLVLEQELGGGGMSRVFVAHEASLGRKVVVKVLPPEMGAAVSIDRFRREIQLAAQLQHPHIVPLLAAGETSGLPYYTMPYVRGESLRARLSKAGELPLAETVRILREVASALAYAHEAGVVHRDIKPENILISGGSAVVTDFGVAKALTASSGAGGSSLTSLGVALGTPAYMAPEQATADPAIDHRADIYSLGVVAYEMLTGSTPFPGRSPQATLAAHVTEKPDAITNRRATVPPLLAALVMRCLEKHAADRPQNANEVMNALDALTTPSGGLTPTSMLPSAKRRPPRMWSMATVGGLVAVLALAFLASAKVRRESLAESRKASPAIAVLPFENVGRKEGDEFADGMTEEITNRLSSLRGLRVIGRQSAKSYANTDKTPQQIASELGVKYLLTGTVRWDKSSEGKDLVRVSPALVNAEDATQVWGEAYQTVLSGVFDVQAKVASEVANALNLSLLAPERKALGTNPTDNLAAYKSFLRGKQLLEESLQTGPIRDAVALLEQATKADPEFAVAWAYLAIAHTELFWYSGDRSPRRLQQASDALAKAAALDSDSPDLHLARGIFNYHGERDYGRALAEFDEARRLRPSEPNVPLYQGAIQRRQGRWEESVRSFRQAIELEPRNGTNMIDLGNTLTILGRYREAEAVVDSGMALVPTEPDGPRLKTSIAIDYRGNVPEAVEHLRNAMRSVSPHSSLIGLLQVWSWPAVEDPLLRQLLLDAKPTDDVRAGSLHITKAMLFRYLGDAPRSRAHADSAIPRVSADIRSSSQPSGLYQELALAEALRGNRAAALQAFAKAEETLPTSMDVFASIERANLRPIILTLLGDNDGAVAEIRNRLAAPGGYTKNYARLNPIFTPLRADARFQRLIQG